MKQRKQFGAASAFSLCFSLMLSGLAHAHTGHGATTGFAHGLEHPVGGLDHMLAMIAVGILAAQQGKRALWAVPLAFVSVMALGGVLGATGVAVPFVEGGIVVSVLALGVLIAAAMRLPLAVSAAIVGVFALFHGHAHGAEMPHAASGLAYGVGFLLSTILLHAIGIGLGLGAQKITKPQAMRFAGAAIAMCSVYLWRG